MIGWWWWLFDRRGLASSAKGGLGACGVASRAVALSWRRLGAHHLDLVVVALVFTRLKGNLLRGFLVWLA